MADGAHAIRGTDGDQYWDANGILRVRTGSVPAVGSSPAHWGIAVYDASGNPVFDTFGIIQHTSLLANSTLQSGTTYVGTGITNLVDMTVNEPAQATFTLARIASVRLETKCTARTSGGSGTFAYTQMSVTGHANVGLELFDNRNVGYVSGSSFLFLNLPAGTYVAKQQAAADVGQTLQCHGGGINVYLLGG